MLTTLIWNISLDCVSVFIKLCTAFSDLAIAGQQHWLLTFAHHLSDQQRSELEHIVRPMRIRHRCLQRQWMEAEKGLIGRMASQLVLRRLSTAWTWTLLVALLMTATVRNRQHFRRKFEARLPHHLRYLSLGPVWYRILYSRFLRWAAAEQTV